VKPGQLKHVLPAYFGQRAGGWDYFFRPKATFDFSHPVPRFVAPLTTKVK